MDSETQEENILLRWYRRYVGPPTEPLNVYGGFALFFAGIAFAVVGIVTFLWSASLAGNPEFVYMLRENAAIFSAVGLPFLLFGVSVLLPVDKRILYVAAAGTAVTLVAVVMFADAYPVYWNVGGARDRSASIVGLYALGIVAVIAATGAALVGYRVERASVPVTVETGVDEPEAETEEITDEQVRHDIDEAMKNVDINWGGVAKSKTRRLQLDVSSPDIDRSGFDNAQAKTARSSGTDDAVSGLKKIQGRDHKMASGGGTDSQTDALRKLREKQQAEELATKDEPDGIVDRFRSLFS